MAVKTVKGIKLGDPVYYKDIRYKIKYFYLDRKKCIIEKVENTPEGHKTVSGLLIKELDPVFDT